jgi:SAM-dependent methyltransferase
MKETKNSSREMFWLSFMTLFVELLVIRWMSSEFRAFTVLKSFPLAACFVGMGLGSAVGNDKYYKWCPLFLLLFAAVTRILGGTDLGVAPFPSTTTYSWLTVGSAASKASAAMGGEAGYMAFFMVFVLVLLAGPFLLCFCMGTRLGILFSASRPLKAYIVNLAGALFGTFVFGAGSMLSVKPGDLLYIPCLFFLIYLWKGTTKHRLLAVLPLVLTVAIGLWPDHKPGVITAWSPYERIDMVPEMAPRKTAAGGSEDILVGYKLLANKVGQQAILDISEKDIASGALPPDVVEQELVDRATHRLAFKMLDTPGEVLTVASGLGNDVDGALACGATKVDAVEIDPITLELGKKFNPHKPYSDPRVHAYCDDARHFINTTKNKYDVVRYAFLDSMTVLAQSSTSRLDNFVYTRESIASAMKLLKPNGIFFLSFYAKEPWFIHRLYWTIYEAAGYKPLAFTYGISKANTDKNVFFVLGDAVKNGTLKLPADMPANLPGPFALVDNVPRPNRILTDDLPYIYFNPTGPDLGYLAVVLEVLAIALFAGRKVLTRKRGFYVWQMFFLGAAFILLELQSISRLSLLYGSTWLTSSIVISGILVMLLIANFFLLKYSKVLYQKLTWLYPCLAVAIGISYLLPVSALLQMGSLPTIGAYVVITSFTLLPMLIAGLIFGSSFDQVKDPGTAIGYNLLGGVVGTLLEYFSSYLGISAMVLVSGGLYLISFLFAQLEQRSPLSAPTVAADEADNSQTN